MSICDTFVDSLITNVPDLNNRGGTQEYLGRTKDERDQTKLARRYEEHENRNFQCDSVEDSKTGSEAPDNLALNAFSARDNKCYMSPQRRRAAMSVSVQREAMILLKTNNGSIDKEIRKDGRFLVHKCKEYLD